ncbi:hypothetical protein DE146DRAFT_607011 [Phaeosphaeria sp. MPI-PUGE-AT-0046c]|nr:hypothetical protein DE146DRAFT_607011 [Phaeosphaeria sp. MPI-PUGE-AT-0046c]
MDLAPLTSVNKSPSAGSRLQQVGLLELLERDPRPTFILNESETTSKHNDFVLPAYSNPALAEVGDGQLLAELKDQKSPFDSASHERKAHLDFLKWVNTPGHSTVSCIYQGYSWSRILLESQWAVIVGAAIKPPATVESAPQSKTLTKISSRTKAPTLDWTDELPPLKMSPHVAWARNIDWSQTPLGPMSSWSSQLRSIANLVMQDPRPAVVFYGPDLIMIYNEAEIELLGGFHPCMGMSARVALASVWPQYFEPIISQNIAGETVVKIDTAIHMVRNGFMEETYFSLKFIPILDSEGATIGHYEPLTETTREVISRRQSQTLLALSEEIPRARNVDSYWTLATTVLSRNDKDIPFALLYSTEDNSSDTESSATRFSGGDHQECTLRGSVGLPADSAAGPTCLDFSKDLGFAPYFRQAMAARKPVIVSFEKDPAAAELVRGIDWQGFGDPCRAAAICPLTPTSLKDNILGFIVIGLNPRRPYDDDYHQFILVASRLLSTSLTSILLHEEDIGRRERTIANAELMKLELKQQLLETQKEVERNALKFQRFADRADVGIFILDIHGVYSYRNQAWFDILAPKDRDLNLDEAWDALIDDEYILLGQVKFEALMATKQHQTLELRLKRTCDGLGIGSGDSAPQKEAMWVLLSIFPELTDEGEVMEIIGCFTDISQQKFSEKLQATQALNAQESKRHEMRNPLSAIVQCADSIISTHRAFGASTDYQAMYRSILDSTIDAAETIVQCSKHMKTIVDDVLTMSKLDSGLFVMTPVEVQLESIARDAVKMFDGEAKLHGITLEFHVEESCQKENIQSVSLDPTRVLQILIVIQNLLTNAIKFTRLEKKRHISVSLGLALEQPSHHGEEQVAFLRSSEASEAKSLQADWEKGQTVYVIFAVRDTGRGLSAQEHDLLFARFSQASPRTHIDYGGSGLGLFISRRLTEMHGGAIGFTSKAGVGSTFAFFVKSRKSKSVLTRRQSETSTAAVGISMRAQASTLTNQSRGQLYQSPSQSAGNDLTMTDLHVLIVEDNLVNQRVLAKQLRNVGMKVAVANHGAEALDHLKTTHYCMSDGSSSNALSLILMDWEMPVMDGLTCVRRIRELQQKGVVHGHVPVIAVTANVRSEQVEVALKAGMDDVISKPFRIPELCACIRKILGTLTV